MIDVQKQVKDIMKMAEETNTTIMEMEGMILKSSKNNQIMNTTNILGISEDLQNLIQSNMENQAYQIQQILASELDECKGQGNYYVDKNIQEIQDLYRDKEQKRSEERKEEDEEVILIKLYKISTIRSRTISSKTTELSFIHDKIKNLEQYMKFVHSPTQTRLFKLPLHYQSLWSRGEQNLEFWKEVAMAFMK